MYGMNKQKSCVDDFSSTQLLLKAGIRTRTEDLLITNQLLYQLSYTGALFCCSDIVPNPPMDVNNKSKNIITALGEKKTERNHIYDSVPLLFLFDDVQQHFAHGCVR